VDHRFSLGEFVDSGIRKKGASYLQKL